MPTLTVEELEIPPEIHTLQGFRAWFAALGEQAPRATFVDGDVWLEMSPQRLDTHEPVVREVNFALQGLTRAAGLGIYYQPPSWITCEAAGFSTEPDGFLVRYDSLRAGAVRVNPERKVELLGRPDFVFEAVSRSSQRKDLVALRASYAKAGVPEYWIADARREPLLTILVMSGDGSYHEVAPDADGYLASPTWARSFRLRPFVNPGGLADIEVQVRP